MFEGAAGTASLDRFDGAMILVRIFAVFSGEFDGCEGFLNGDANVFFTLPLDVGVRPRPTRRSGAGVLMAIGVSTFCFDSAVVHSRIGAVLVVVRSGVRKDELGSVVVGGTAGREARAGVAVELTNGRNGVLNVGGSMDVLCRRGVLIGSSPKIAIALRRASSLTALAGAPDPLVKPMVGTFDGVAMSPLRVSAGAWLSLFASLSA